MSLQRAASPLAQILARLPSSFNIRPTSSRACTQCHSFSHARQAPVPQFRRRLATAVAHQPQSFNTELPPRNAGIPETSIAGSRSQADDARRARTPEGSSIEPQYPSNASITEAEAQISKPTDQAIAATGSPTTPTASVPNAISEARPRRSKLRPRKAAMTLSSAAVEQLRELLNQPEPKLIRVGVKNRGCSGLAYHLEYVDKPGTFDEAVDQDDVKVLIDSKALFSIIGSEMDWVEDKLSRRFVFRNPNITEQCGCGESFSIS